MICAQDAPDHTTIARSGRPTIRQWLVVCAVLELAGEAGLGRWVIAVDGTRIAANASCGEPAPVLAAGAGERGDG